jgi:hypothetical protein
LFWIIAKAAAISRLRPARIHIMRKLFKHLLIVIIVFLAVAQFLRPDRINPPINLASTFEAVAHPSPEVASILKRACYDCHSNGTVWPWYSKVAPVSWLVASDVKAGRLHLNFSEWGLLSPEMAQRRYLNACDEVKGGDMPLWQYRLMHSEANLSDQDVATLRGAAPPSR